LPREIPSVPLYGAGLDLTLLAWLLTLADTITEKLNIGGLTEEIIGVLQASLTPITTLIGRIRSESGLTDAQLVEQAQQIDQDTATKLEALLAKLPAAAGR